MKRGANAAARARCPKCGQFQHTSIECGKPGPKVRTTPEQRAETSRSYSMQWRKDNPDRWREIQRKSRQAVRERVLRHYAGTSTEPACKCCGEAGIAFLTLDHVNGDGAERRRAAGSRGGVHYYRTLIRQDFPSGYQVLCWNCNVASGVTGVCPHTLKR